MVGRSFGLCIDGFWGLGGAAHNSYQILKGCPLLLGRSYERPPCPGPAHHAGSALQ